MRAKAVIQLMRDRPGSALWLVRGLSPRILDIVEGMLRTGPEPDVFDALLDVALARGRLETRRAWFGDRRTGERGLDRRRAAVLARLDAALTEAVDVLKHPDDARLWFLLRPLQAVVRERARHRAEPMPTGRAAIADKAQLLSRLVSLGATARDARHLLAHLPPIS
jgi:hypothetical protein